MKWVFKAKIKFFFFFIQVIFLISFITALLAGLVFQITGNITGNITISLMGFSGTVLLLLSLMHPLTCSYIVSNKGIQLHALLIKDVFIPYSEIKELRSLDKEEAHKIWIHLQEEELKYRTTYDISGYFRLWKKHRQTTSFCTVQPLQTEVSQGNEMNITSYKTVITGKYVLLKDIREKVYLLSPKDIEGMLKTAGKYLPVRN